VGFIAANNPLCCSLEL